MDPEFHKPTIDFIYIVAVIKSSTKQLSKQCATGWKILTEPEPDRDHFDRNRTGTGLQA